MYFGGDPDKVNVDGYAQGSLLAANAAGVLTTVPIGVAPQVLTVDAGEPTLVDWEPPPGAAHRMRQAYITAGSTVLPNTAGVWAIVAGYELQIPAVAGDYVELSTTFLNTPNNSTFLDFAVVVGAAIVRYMATGTAAPGFEGNPGLYPNLTFRTFKSPVGFVVTPGDLDGANVRWVLVSKSTSGVGTVFSDANYPFYWRSINIGAVT